MYITFAFLFFSSGLGQDYFLCVCANVPFTPKVKSISLGKEMHMHTCTVEGAPQTNL